MDDQVTTVVQMDDLEAGDSHAREETNTKTNITRNISPV